MVHIVQCFYQQYILPTFWHRQDYFVWHLVIVILFLLLLIVKENDGRINQLQFLWVLQYYFKTEIVETLFNFWITPGLRGHFTWKLSSVTFKPFKYLISNNSVDLPLKTVASILLHQDRQGAYNLMQNH